jgi:5-methylcytosine-specific restriction endonuclease McrA
MNRLTTEDLRCHHITGVEINPVESADLDNCITLCYNCHSRVHSSGQCDVRKQPCEV